MMQNQQNESIRKFFTILFVFLGLGIFAFLGFTARQTSSWIPVNGYVKWNTVNKRTIQYVVNGKYYSTENENLLNLFEQRFHIKVSYSRPGQGKKVVNGVDPEIGRQVVVYYNPDDHSQAIVNRGWSAPVVILLICSVIPLIISVGLGTFAGWDQNQNSGSNNPW